MIYQYSTEQKEILTQYALDQKAIPARFALQKTGRSAGDAIKDICEYYHKPLAQLAITQIALARLENDIETEKIIRSRIAKAPIINEVLEGTFAWNDKISEVAKSLNIIKYDIRNIDKDHMALIDKYRKFIYFEINRKLRFTLVTKTYEDHFTDYVMHAIWIYDSYTGKKPVEEIYKIITTSLQQLSNQKAIDHQNAEVTTVKLDNGDYLSMANSISSVTNYDSEAGADDIFEFLLGDATVHDTEDNLMIREIISKIREHPVVQRIMKEIKEQGLDPFTMRESYLKWFLTKNPEDEDQIGHLEYLYEQLQELRAA